MLTELSSAPADRMAAFPPSDGAAPKTLLPLAVNARVTHSQMGGQQRVTAEILRRLGPVETIAPGRPLAGLKGHLWEQTVLPWRARGRLLWSPSATGPLIQRRQVVTLHDVAFLDVPQFFSASFVRFYATLLPQLVRTVLHIVTVSEFSKARIIATLGADPARVSVILNGVSEQFRLYSRDEIDRVRRTLDLPQRYVLLQATSDKRKNLARVLELWRDLRHELPPDLWLVVAGALGREHVFGTLGALQQMPRMRLLGFVDEGSFAPLIAGAEAFLYPSLYEGFGLPILEAMSCGTPVLTSAATATQEIAGDAALLVDPASSRSLAEGLHKLTQDAELRTHLRDAGRHRAAQFSWERAAQSYQQLFTEIAARPLGRDVTP